MVHKIHSVTYFSHIMHYALVQLMALFVESFTSDKEAGHKQNNNIIVYDNNLVPPSHGVLLLECGDHRLGDISL